MSPSNLRISNSHRPRRVPASMPAFWTTKLRAAYLVTSAGRKRLLHIIRPPLSLHREAAALQVHNSSVGGASLVGAPAAQNLARTPRPSRRVRSRRVSGLSIFVIGFRPRRKGNAVVKGFAAGNRKTTGYNALSHRRLLNRCVGQRRAGALNTGTARLSMLLAGPKVTSYRIVCQGLILRRLGRM
jgi:hypothetical protein